MVFKDNKAFGSIYFFNMSSFSIPKIGGYSKNEKTKAVISALSGFFLPQPSETSCFDDGPWNAIGGQPQAILQQAQPHLTATKMI